MKMWAVFDKDGNMISDACDTKDEAWISQPTDGDACTCQPVVVMREEVYNGMSEWTKSVANGIDKFNNPYIDEFLKAGE